MIKPPVMEDRMLLIVGPRSENTSISRPPASLSVIMLLPKAVFNEARRGYIKTSTSRKKTSQTISMPFRDLHAR